MILNALPIDRVYYEFGLVYDIIIKVSAASYGLWLNNQVELVEFGKMLSNELFFSTKISSKPPVFHIFGDPQLSGDQIHITAVQYKSDSNDTTYLDSSAQKNMLQENFILDPYLIDQNSQSICIAKSAFNIGRRIDNDLVIDDARVSRQHAQIRFSPKGCILFDLKSTGGTFINNKMIEQQKLQSGDVISLAGVNLLYGEENRQEQDLIEVLHPNHSVTKPPQDFTDDHLEYIG